SAPWLRCSSVEDPRGIFSFIAPRHRADGAKTAPLRIFRQALSQGGDGPARRACFQRRRPCNLVRMLGSGILKGMVETARNFVGSYTEAARLTTVEYPEDRLPLQEATRQFPFLVYDGTDAQAGLRCVACQICEKECPPQCIYIEKSKDKKPDYV